MNFSRPEKFFFPPLAWSLGLGKVQCARSEIAQNELFQAGKVFFSTVSLVSRAWKSSFCIRLSFSFRKLQCNNSLPKTALPSHYKSFSQIAIQSLDWQKCPKKNFSLDKKFI